MTGSYREHRDRWESLSEIDYLSAFIKAWLAFNAYYRDAYTDSADRDIIDAIKNSDTSNPVRSYFVPLIDSSTPEAEMFKNYVGELHKRLEGYMLYSGKGISKRKISMRDVLVRTSKKPDVSRNYKRVSYEVKTKFNSRGKLTGSSIKVVDRSSGFIKIEASDQKYDKKFILDHNDFANLSQHQQGYLLSLYDSINPYDYIDLTNSGAKIIRCGSIDFASSAEDIFAGTLEVVYALRCLLFHGELNPNVNAANIYEPAYYIVRQILHAVK